MSGFNSSDLDKAPQLSEWSVAFRFLTFRLGRVALLLAIAFSRSATEPIKS